MFVDRRITETKSFCFFIELCTFTQRAQNHRWHPRIHLSPTTPIVAVDYVPTDRVVSIAAGTTFPTTPSPVLWTTSPPVDSTTAAVVSLTMPIAGRGLRPHRSCARCCRDYVPTGCLYHRHRGFTLIAVRRTTSPPIMYSSLPRLSNKTKDSTT